MSGPPPSVIAGRVRRGNDLRRGEVRYDKTAAASSIPRDVVREQPCPRCQAPAGQMCVRLDGGPRISNHRERVRAAQAVAPAYPPRRLRFTCLMCQQKAAGWLCSKHLGPSTLSE